MDLRNSFSHYKKLDVDKTGIKEYKVYRLKKKKNALGMKNHLKVIQNS